MQASENSESLQKQNTNLQQQAQKYALMLSEEKKEKQQVRKRYDILQEKHEALSQSFHEKQQLRSSQKIKLVVLTAIV